MIQSIEYGLFYQQYNKAVFIKKKLLFNFFILSKYIVYFEFNAFFRKHLIKIETIIQI